MYGNTKKVKSWVRTLQLEEITCKVIARLLFLTLCSQSTLSLPLKKSETFRFSYVFRG